MKNVFFLAFYCLLISQLTAQNSHDPYLEHTGSQFFLEDVLNCQEPLPVQCYHGGYDGEYQIILSDFHWAGVGAPGGIYDLSYKIEAVSFPFVPFDDLHQPGSKVLVMPDLESYSYNDQPGCKGWAWDENDPTIEPDDHDLKRVVTGNFSVANNGGEPDLISEQASLASNFFRNQVTITNCGNTGYRDVLPHTVLKHTIYASNNGTILDSLSWVYDHTRGRMRWYPFTEPGGGTMINWDVHFRPKVIVDPNGHDYLQTENGSWYAQGGVPNFNTANYFHTPANVLDLDGALYPSDWTSPFWPFYNQNYILHPPPFSLLETPLLNNNGSGYAGYITQGTPNNQQETFFSGNTAYQVAHTYLIDKPLDLRIINPHEQVIYNPSHAIIQMDAQYAGEPFVFPSGYTFKTVHGVYPSAGDVAAADPDGLYGHPDLAPVPSTVTGNPDKSLYVVEADQHLIIEPCVTIISAKIRVMPGGMVTYYPSAFNGIDFEWDWQPGSIENDLLWTADPPCPWDCYSADHYDVATDLVISASGTWSPGNLPVATKSYDILRLSGDLVFESGAIVDMNNIDIEFGPKGRMIVQRGAEIHATNVTFTAACMEMWEGIQVWGTRNASQSQQNYNPDQGILIMDACSLEYTRLGAAVYRPDTWEDFSDYNGGILHADNTVFRNNHVPVEIRPTINNHNNLVLNNKCHFGYCQFITDDYLLDPAYTDGELRSGPPTYVKLEGVRGVSFYGCTFSTSLPGNDEFKPHRRGTGINSKLSTFSVYQSHFEGLTEGILGQGTPGGANTARIRHNTFGNTIHNIVIEELDFVHIVGNTIDLPESPMYGYDDSDINKGIDHPVGLFFLASTFFHIEGNTINATSEAVLDPDYYSYAITIADAGDEGGQVFDDGTAWVYRNTINSADPSHSVNIGIQCERNNQGDQTLPEEPYGLFIECNTFEEESVNDFDITVVGDFLNPGFEPGTLRDQGLCDDQKDQAGNQYSSCGNDDQQIFFDPNYSNASRLQFEHKDQAALNPDVTCSNILNANIENCPLILGVNPCDVLENCGKPCIESLLGQLMAKMMVTEDELAQLTDSTEILAKQKELGYQKGKVLLYQNMLMHEALMFETIDSAIARGWERIDNVKEAKLAALYKEKGDLAKADSLVQVAETKEGTPSEQTEVLKLEVEKAQQNKDLKDIDDAEEQALEDKIEEDPGGAHASKVVLEYARRKRHPRSPLPLVDTNPGYRSSALVEPVTRPSMKLVPNPTENLFKVVLDGVDMGSVNIGVVDITGRSLDLPYRMIEERTIEMDGSTLKAGIYLIVVTSGGNQWEEKLMVLR